MAWSQFDSPTPYGDGVWWDPRGALAPPAFFLSFARNKDEAIGTALESGTATPDKQKQVAEMAIVQQRLAADLPYIWLTHNRLSVIAADRVVNVNNWRLPNPQNITDGGKGLDMQRGAHPLYQVWLKK